MEIKIKNDKIVPSKLKLAIRNQSKRNFGQAFHWSITINKDITGKFVELVCSSYEIVKTCRQIHFLEIFSPHLTTTMPVSKSSKKIELEENIR